MKLFIILWLGEMISAIGSGLTSFGLSVYIFRETGSAFLVSLIALTSFLPFLLLSVPAGILSDRFDRRALMVVGDVFSGLGVLYILLAIVFKLPFFHILIGSAISSSFSALIDPAFKATISDLLTKEEYAKAGGLNGLTSGARFIISPLLAALLLSISSIKLLLLIDILSFIPTIIAASIVKTKISTSNSNQKVSIFTGFKALNKTKGLVVLTVYVSLLTFFMGTIQILSEPMILSFSSATVLSLMEVVCASGMIVSGIIISKRGIKNSYRNVLCLSLFMSGLSMVGFGATLNLFVIVPFGFTFFLAIPYANTSLDYLVRSNLKKDEEGSIWGAIGFISQLGYVFSYSLSGYASDYLAKILNISVGRGCSLVIVLGGILLALLSILMLSFKSIKGLEYA